MSLNKIILHFSQTLSAYIDYVHEKIEKKEYDIEKYAEWAQKEENKVPIPTDEVVKEAEQELEMMALYTMLSSLVNIEN